MLGPASVLSCVGSVLWALWEGVIPGFLGNYAKSCQRGMGTLERGNSWHFGELCKLWRRGMDPLGRGNSWHFGELSKVVAAWYGPSVKEEILELLGII